MTQNTAAMMSQFPDRQLLPQSEAAAAFKLQETQRREVLEFLAERPLRTVYLAGLIRDNGLVSPLNRGDFYGCRNANGELEGVALIGHATLVEARTGSALRAFAEAAKECRTAHMIIGEQEVIERFWSHYSDGGRAPRLVCRELFFEKRGPSAAVEEVASLRVATIEDLGLVVPVHARLAFEESGVNPLERDPEGFRLRCARRISQGRVWVAVEDGRLIFKADVVSDTPAGVYLEGIYVSPEERGKGYGLRCLTQMCRGLLSRTRAVGLLVNETNAPAVSLYEGAGFELQGLYDTIFLQQER